MSDTTQRLATSNKTTKTADDLYEEWKAANSRMDAAANYLAYDVTFRAADPNGYRHQKASAQLTQELKARFMDAHAAAAAAFEAWQKENRNRD